MKIFSSKARFIPGTLLITGTCVGAGMLGLPGITGPSGALPAFVATTVCFVVMLLTGLLFLEATLWLPEDSNLISITGKILGRRGKWVATFFFLFLYYCLMVAYISGGSPILPIPYSSLIFPLIFALLVYFGPHMIGRVNALLMIGFGVSYFLLLGITLPLLQIDYFIPSDWSVMSVAAPVLFSAFGFHNIIPSLSTYMHRDHKQLTRSIILGTLLSYLIYLFWQWAVIGSVPREYLIEAKQEGVPITQILETFSDYPWLARLSRIFAFFALVTSLIGVSLSMVDFLADGLQVKKKGGWRVLLVAMVYLPPTFFALIYPNIFLTSLGLAGGVGEAILNSLIPIALIYVGRKRFNWHPQLRWIAAPWLLVLLSLFTLVVMGIEITHLFY
jgi:tyrosine-specific transport protein